VGWFRSLFAPSDPIEDLPLSARIALLEGDMLQLHAQSDSMHTSLRKLQGKVYRGVSLGETVDSAKPVSDGGGVEGNSVEVASSKADLYRRASQLRGR